MSVRTLWKEEELAVVAREVLRACSPKEGAHTIALSGDLGAGKTAFVKALARELGIKDHVTSPTFVIMKSYGVAGHPFLTTLTHIDAYRIESEDEMRVLGFGELLGDQNRIICIEWPERIFGLIPDDAYHITIEIHADGSRTITYGE